MRTSLCPVIVGRDAELSVLTAALDAATAGQGSAWFVTGDAGIGKSRLARAVVDHALERRALICRGRAVSGSAAAPYRPLTEALLGLGRDQRLLGHPSLAPFSPALARVVPGWPVPADRGPPDGDDADSPLVLGEGVLRLLRVAAAGRAAVVVLEDLHWSDDDTLAVIEFLADNLMAEPVVLLATTRTEPVPTVARLATSLRARGAAQVIELGPLDDDATVAMATACVGHDLPDAVRDVITARAEGVPFFVEELLAVVAERGPEAIPPTFAASVAQRVDELDPDARRVIEAAAVLGRSFEWTLLGAVTGLDDAAVMRALRAARDRQLVGTGGEGEDGDALRFRHALTRDAVAARLLPPERAAISTAALDAIEAREPELPGGWVELAADLAEQANLPVRAAELWLETGCRAVVQGALSTAEAALDRARSLAGERGDIATRAGEALVAALTLAGRTDRVFEVGEVVLAALRSGSDLEDRRRAAELHLLLARAAARCGDWRLAHKHVAATGDDADDASLRARTLLLAAEVAIGQGDTDAARAAAEDALGVARAARLPELEASALELVGRVYRDVDLETAETRFMEAARVADAHDLMLRRVSALHELGTLEVYRFRSAARLELARELATQFGDLHVAAHAAMHAAVVHLFRDEIDRAEGFFTSARDEAARYRMRELQAGATVGLALVAVARGDDAEASAFLDEGLRISPDPERETLAHGLGHALIALLHEDRAAARAHLDRSYRASATRPGLMRSPATGLWALVEVLEGTDDWPVRALCDAHGDLNVVNAGLAASARAVLAGRRNDDDAAALFAHGDAALAVSPRTRQLARRLVAEAALADGWGEPVGWLREAEEYFTQVGRERVAAACRALLRDAGVAPPRRRAGEESVPPELRAFGLTSREVEVLRLVREGLTNAEIAQRLFLSRRTVEKHVERLLAKTGTANRTQLVALRT